MRFPANLLLLSLALIVPPVAAEEACSEPPVAITDVRLFDGVSVIPRATVVTRCTTIWRIVDGSGSGSPLRITVIGPVREQSSRID